jgi:RNA polymerase sigma factor (sigma-70 family)
MTDQELLDAFARQKDQRAFAELVTRHMDWVYSCAKRLVREEELARDVAQAVFVLLSRKAARLRGHPQIAGWLFKATRYSASNAMKQLARRRRHEREAWEMKKQLASGEEANWEEMWPALDEAVRELTSSDRDTVLLRFYQGQSAAQMGAAMGVSEEAAKKRLQRALERLRNRLTGKGISEGVSGLAVVLATKVTQAAPTGLAQSAASVATTSGAATLSSAIAKAASNAMWWAKAKIAAGIVIAVGAAAGTGYGVTHRALAQAPGAVANASPAVVAVATAEPVASSDFDVLYEKAPGSAADLTMKLGPNTFAVTSVVRFGGDGKPVAVDNQGKVLDASTLPLDKVAAPTSGEGEVVIVFLQPGVDRYDIDRLRLFNHYTRRRVNDYIVTPVPGLSALRISVPAGTLPAKVDLWMAACSYDESNKPVSLPAKKDGTAKIGAATVGFVDIRDGQWSFPNGKWEKATLDDGSAGHYTTIQLKGTGNWNVGRYQFTAVASSGAKYISDFFVDLSNDSQPFSFYPIGLNQLDHF